MNNRLRRIGRKSSRARMMLPEGRKLLRWVGQRYRKKWTKKCFSRSSKWKIKIMKLARMQVDHRMNLQI